MINWKSLFKRKPKPPLPPPKPRQPGQDTFDKILELNPDGREFQYLGRTMIIIGQETRVNRYGEEDKNKAPNILTQYADENGVIRSHKFAHHTWHIVLKALTAKP